jgi:hypothetical protein
MDAIRYLLGYVFKLAIVLFIGAFALWLVNFVYPDLKVRELLSFKFLSGDWLPAPKQYGLLGKNNQKDQYGSVYVHNNQYPSFMSPNDVGYVLYTATGTQIVRNDGTVFSGNTSAHTARSAYVRNLSFYDGGAISYGSTYTGEARESMFRNGTFPIVIVDNQGRVITSTHAINTGSWAAPGWIRFQFAVPVRLPQIPCGLVFLSAQDTRIGFRMNMRCN